jgi:NadR type nicotinamide-nucleotide adenylyltransferase
MKKIVVLGPECTGKTTLCKQLAKHYQTVYCPEFSREYLSALKRRYTYDDLLNIAIGQLELEDAMLTEANNGFYIIDSDMCGMKLWCETAFNNCHPWILKQIAAREYDLHLLCRADLPWKPHPLREYPSEQLRQKHFKMFKNMMINKSSYSAEVYGKNSSRLEMAVSIINSAFAKSNAFHNSPIN